MRTHLLLAGLAAAALVPSLAAAQTSCQEQRHDNRVVGTVVGAGLGALLGNAIGEGGGRTGGTIIGAVGGGVVGNQVAGAATNCDRYGYYDSDGRWIATSGYGDAYGQRDYSPPAGHYDDNGRWVSAPASGHYDENGAWIDAAGAPEPRWDPDARSAAESGSDVGYTGREMWAGAPYDTLAREDWLARRIKAERAQGRLEDRDAAVALDEVRSIRVLDESERSYSGRLSASERISIQARLDDVRQRLND